MTYLSLEDVKKHLNLDSEFTDDDAYVSALADAAEEVVSKYIDYPLTQLEDENRVLPRSLVQAMLLWIGNAYAIRESVTASAMSPVPHAFELLCDLHRNYTINKDE